VLVPQERLESLEEDDRRRVGVRTTVPPTRSPQGLLKGPALRLPEPQQPGVVRSAALADRVVSGLGLRAACPPGARGSSPASNPLRRLRRADGRHRFRAFRRARPLRYELDDVPSPSQPRPVANDLAPPRSVEGAHPPRSPRPIAVAPPPPRRWFATDRALARRADAPRRHTAAPTPPRLTPRDVRPPNRFPSNRLWCMSPGFLNQGLEFGFANSNP